MIIIQVSHLFFFLSKIFNDLLSLFIFNSDAASLSSNNSNELLNDVLESQITPPLQQSSPGTSTGSTTAFVT